MSGANEPTQDLSNMDAHQLEQTIDAFEEAWQKGERPLIEDYLADIECDRTACLIELVHVDLEYRLKAGHNVRIEEYFECYPELRNDSTIQQDLIAAEQDLRSRPEKPSEKIATRSQYRVLHTYAKGGLGEIRIAVDQQLNREVALKLIQKPHAHNPESRRRFLREAEITSRLEHPGIVPVYGVGQDQQGNPVYSMRFIRGESLQEAIERFHSADKPGRAAGERTLAFRNLLGRFLVVCNTIAYAHSRGVLHRDLKPSNIMLGQYGETLVVDWGLAKNMGESEDKEAYSVEIRMASEDRVPLSSNHSPTRIGVAIGTPAFMSPEQAAGRWDQVGPASDIYSLGATLYMLLTGQQPFQNSDVRDLLEKVQKGEIVSPRVRKKDVPPALEALCLKAMALDPKKRYPTVLDLAVDLEHWLADEPVSAWKEPIGVTINRWLSRHRTLMAGSAAAVLAGLITLAAMTLFLTAANQEAREQLNRADANFYYHRITLADQAWGANQIQQAKQRLEECKSDLRQWEWYLLHRRCREHQTTLAGHTDAVHSVAFDPTGQKLASGSQDGTVKIWDSKTGDEMQTLRGHSDAVFGIAFSPNGQRLASSSRDNSVVVWELTTAKKVLTLTGPKQGLRTVAFNARGDLLAAAGDDSTVFLWNAETGREMEPFHGHTGVIWKVAFSPDGRWLASASADKTVRIWDVASREVLYVLRGHQAAVHGLAFRRDGKWLASAGADHTIKIWNAFLGKEIQSFGNLPFSVREVAFSPDGRKMAYGGDDPDLKVVDVTSRELITYRGHRQSIAGVVFHPNGNEIATASADKTIKIWDPTFRQTVQNLAGHARLQALAFHPDGKLLVTGSFEGTIKIWNPKTWKVIGNLEGHQGPVWGLAFRPDGRHLASSSDDRKVKIWDVTTGKNVLTLSGHTQGIAGVVYSPDGKLLATAGDDHKVIIWDADSGKQKHLLTDHTDVVWTVAFSPDGKRLASGSADKSVKIWDTDTWKVLITLRETGGTVFQLAFSPNGLFLAASGGETDDPVVRNPAGIKPAPGKKLADKQRAPNPWGEIEVWEVASGKRIFHLPGHTEPVRGLAFSPDSRRLASAGYDGTVKLWNTANGQEILTLYRYFGPFYGLAFSPDGHQLLGAAWELKLWDATPIAE
ncbi:MAG TPA: protein kinase [Gemmataceae bacterium]|jgi:WD40 repeat protein/serine/threonine protein kinase|nr:protein kinase [Gemmataceae bacterium]